MRHILVATDFSDGAERALTLGCTLAGHSNAEITAAHVAPGKGRDFTDAHDRLEAHSLRLRRTRGMTLQIATVMGQPGERLVRLVEERRADLIIVAASSKTKLQKWLIGSTATQLLHTSPVPVLVVGPEMGTEIRSIVVGCAYTDQCAQAYRAADTIGRGFGAKIEVVHVSAEAGDIAIVGGKTGVTSRRREELRLEAWCAEQLPDPACGVAAHHLISDASGRQLADHVNAIGADLVAVGSHDRGILSRLRNPLTGDFILENIQCGLLSVR